MAEERRPLDRFPYVAFPNEHLDRILKRPHLAGIGISGCIGVGLFVTSGSLVSMTGSLGAAISYAVAGVIVACVFYSITEMVACRPLTGALVDLPHTFVDPACGFTVASLYALGEICCMATLTAHSAELTALLRTDGKPHKIGEEFAINLGFIALTTLSHCLGVKLYGKIERVVMWFKLSLLALVIILMVALNFGGGGRVPQTVYSQNYTTHGFTPGWAPTGFTSTSPGPLRLSGVSEKDFGISGAGGSLFAFITSISLAMFSCFGADLVAMTAGEAANPWKDVPATMSFVYLVPLTIYPFAMLAGSANLNYANPDLPKIWVRGGTPKSIFVIAAQESSLHALPKVLNAFFIISAYTTANTYLYAASRNVFMLAQNYAPMRIARVLGRTNHGKTPLASILFCSALGFLSLVGLTDKAGNQPRITMSELYTGTAACVNLCQCITFLRFKAGLDRLESLNVFSRNDALYVNHLFKSRWQPVPAYVGIVGCGFVIVWSGIPPLILLVAKSSLTSTGTLKSTTSLAFDVFGAYIGPFLFALLYFTYKYIHPRSSRVDLRNLTVAHYVLEDLSTIELDDAEEGPPVIAPAQPPFEAHELAAQNANVDGQNAPAPRRSADEEHNSDEEMDLEMQAEIAAEDAKRRERERITRILERRTTRLERGFWKELWSFVVGG